MYYLIYTKNVSNKSYSLLSNSCSCSSNDEQEQVLHSCHRCRYRADPSVVQLSGSRSLKLLASLANIILLVYYVFKVVITNLKDMQYHTLVCM